MYVRQIWHLEFTRAEILRDARWQNRLLICAHVCKWLHSFNFISWRLDLQSTHIFSCFIIFGLFIKKKKCLEFYNFPSVIFFPIDHLSWLTSNWLNHLHTDHDDVHKSEAETSPWYGCDKWRLNFGYMHLALIFVCATQIIINESHVNILNILIWFKILLLQFYKNLGVSRKEIL